MTQRPPAFDRIRRHLRRTRARLQFRASAVGLGWLLTTLGALALALVLLASTRFAAAWIRPFALLALVAAGLWVLWHIVARPIRAVWRERDVAEAIEAHIDLHDGLIASEQFGRDWGQRAFDAPDLVQALAVQTAEDLDKADLRAVVSWAPLRRPWLGVGAVALLAVLLSWVAPRALSRGWDTLWPTPGERDVERTGPLVGDLTLTLHAPAYTGRSPRTIPNSAGAIEVPKGTRVELTATTLAPAQSVALHFGDAPPRILALTVAEGRDVQGSFVVEKAGPWRFAVSNTEGDVAVESEPRHIQIEPDEPPSVTLHLPAEDLELEDLRAVPVKFEARDDFGLSRAAIVVALAADPDHPEKIEQAGMVGKRARGRAEVDLTIIQAEPGDRIALSVEAFDNNGVDGPQVGRSVTRFITVHSPQAKHYALAEKLRATVDALLDGLANHLEFDWAKAQPAPSARIAATATGSRDAAKKLAEVVTEMTEDPLTPDEVRLALAGRLGALEKSLDALDTSVAQFGAALDAGERRGRVVRKDAENVIEQLEQAIILVEAMVARLALEDMAALTSELNAAREKLREMIQQYKENPDPALKKQIMRNIQRLRDRMREIKARMAQLQQKLPEEFLNLEGLKGDEVSKGLEASSDELDELEKLLEEGRLDEALAALDRMEAALNELDSALGKDMQDLHNETNPAMQQAISELMDQTRSIMKQQQAVNEETEAAAKAAEEALREVLDDTLGEKIEGLKEKAEEVAERAKSIDDARFFLPAKEGRRRVVSEAEALQGALERKRLDQALESARQARDAATSMERFTRDSDGEPREQIEEVQRMSQQIADELAEMLQQARQRSQQASDAEAMQSLQERQSQLAESTERLRQRMDAKGDEVPGLRDRPMQQAQRAGEAMERASQRLGRQRPGQARPGQQQAMNELRGLMEGLKKAGSPQRAERENNRGRNHERDVDIPDADEYAAPEAFRKELLDAMKSKAPESYREQVKRYYESLIQ